MVGPDSAMIPPMLVKTIPVGLALFALAPIATAADSPPTAQPAPARDSFHGRITSATGKLRRDQDRIQIWLLRSTGPDPKAVTITLAGSRCHHRKHCARIAGTLTGTMTQRPPHPDIGAEFTLSVSGSVRPLGHVTARGTANGTGFVKYGYETLHLKLTRGSASVTIEARSGRVPGFTGP